MFKILDATPEHIPLIQRIAEETWWPTYSPILTNEQIEYMLGAIYNTEALSDAFNQQAQKFILLEDDNDFKGFASYSSKTPGLANKLCKLYVRPSNHGKGYGKHLIDEIKVRTKKEGLIALDLNVNRFNPALSFYKKLGFKIIGEEDVPIGPYWMNDYILRLDL